MRRLKLIDDRAVIAKTYDVIASHLATTVSSQFLVKIT